MPNSKERQVEIGDRYVALYHVVYRHEGFDQAAQDSSHWCETLKQGAQQATPTFLDIEGHRNEQGSFDSEMLELQEHFLVGFLGQFLSEIHCPLATWSGTAVKTTTSQIALISACPAGEA